MAMTKKGSFRTSMNGFHRGDVMAFIEELSIDHEKEQKILKRQILKLKEELKQAKEHKKAEPVAEEVPAVEPGQELEAYRRAEAVERKAKEQAETMISNVQAVIAQTQGMWATSQEEVSQGISQFSCSLAELERQLHGVQEMLQLQEKALNEAL